MNDLALMRLHADVLFTHDAAGCIVATNEPDGDRAPRLFLGRTRDGVVWRVRDDVPAEMAADLERICRDEPPLDDPRAQPVTFDALRAVLSTHSPVTEVSQGPAWRFPEAITAPESVVEIGSQNSELVQRYFPYTAEHIHERWPRFAVIADGIAVSICYSARLSASAAEAGLYTVEEYRGRGYAARVVVAWAREVRRSGRTPLYSTSSKNVASQRVASKLSLILYGVDLSLA